MATITELPSTPEQHDETVYKCSCGKPAVKRMSRTPEHPNMEFYQCARSAGGCKFFKWVHEVSGAGVRATTIPTSPTTPTTPARSRGPSNATTRTPARNGTGPITTPGSGWRTELAAEFGRLNTNSTPAAPSSPTHQRSNFKGGKPYTPSSKGRGARQAALMEALATAEKDTDKIDENGEEPFDRAGSPTPAGMGDDKEIELPPIRGVKVPQTFSSLSSVKDAPTPPAASSSRLDSSARQPKSVEQSQNPPSDLKQFLPHLHRVLKFLPVDSELQKLPAHMQRSSEAEQGLKRKLEDLEAQCEAAREELQTLTSSSKRRRVGDTLPQGASKTLQPLTALPRELEGPNPLEGVERYHIKFQDIADVEELKLLHVQFKRDESELWNYQLRPAKEKAAQLRRKVNEKKVDGWN